MGFSDRQVQALRRNLDTRHVRTRESNGREVSYIEGWYAISEANRIFGFDGWSRETLDSKCVLARENRGAFTAVYTAKVRITVQADGAAVIWESHGTGEGRGRHPGRGSRYSAQGRRDGRCAFRPGALPQRQAGAFQKGSAGKLGGVEPSCSGRGNYRPASKTVRRASAAPIRFSTYPPSLAPLRAPAVSGFSRAECRAYAGSTAARR